MWRALCCCSRCCWCFSRWGSSHAHRRRGARPSPLRFRSKLNQPDRFRRLPDGWRRRRGHRRSCSVCRNRANFGEPMTAARRQGCTAEAVGQSPSFKASTPLSMAITTRCIGWIPRSSRPDFKASDHGTILKADTQADIISLWVILPIAGQSVSCAGSFSPTCTRGPGIRLSE